MKNKTFETYTCIYILCIYRTSKICTTIQQIKKKIKSAMKTLNK